MFAIEKDVPFHSVKRRVGNADKKYPFFSEMEVGDSFLATPDKIKSLTILNAAGRYRRRNPGWQYASRTEEDGVRIWRTA